MVDLCGLARARSIATWDLLRRAWQARMPMGEETLTELNLVELSLRSQGQIVIFPSTKYLESQIGADWEWWIHGKKGWIGMRVQAKVLNRNKDRYDHLWYRTPGQTSFQIDRLIAASAAAKLFPLYMLYNNWDPAARSVVKRCGSSRMKPQRAMGCAIAAATSIKPHHARPDGNAAVHILELAFPFECLFCSAISFDLIDNVTQALRRAAGTVPDGTPAPPWALEVLEEPPPHVAAALLGDFSVLNEGAVESGIAGLVVIHERVPENEP